LANGCAWNAVSAFANCGRAVARVRGSYVPRTAIAPRLFDHGETGLNKALGYVDVIYRYPHVYWSNVAPMGSIMAGS
jgi:hypothetical protein